MFVCLPTVCVVFSMFKPTFAMSQSLSIIYSCVNLLWL